MAVKSWHSWPAWCLAPSFRLGQSGEPDAKALADFLALEFLAQGQEVVLGEEHDLSLPLVDFWVLRVADANEARQELTDRIVLSFDKRLDRTNDICFVSSSCRKSTSRYSVMHNTCCTWPTTMRKQ